MRPRLLDLFCGAGGAAVGYHRAGFDVVGVDIAPQPHYPFKFIQGDALGSLGRPKWIAESARQYDAIHASPPCQAFTAYRRAGNVGAYPDLIAETRRLLQATGLLYVIENVEGAPLEEPRVRLCGSSFALDVRRHRWFETNWPLLSLACVHGAAAPGRFAPAANRVNRRATVEVGVWRIPLAEQKRAMGIEHEMTLEELSEAIPPAYTEFVGAQLLERLARAAA